MLLGTQVDLGPRHIVLDGDPAPLLKKEAEPPPIFGTLHRPGRLSKRICALRVHRCDR